VAVNHSSRHRFLVSLFLSITITRPAKGIDLHTIDPWFLQASLTAPQGASGDYFSSSVAVSGDTAVVGAWGENNATGAAYVYTRSGSVWTQVAKLTPSDAAPSDYFGSAVAVNGDTVLAGAWAKSGGMGAAYVFVRSGTVWSQQAKLTAADAAAHDNFGRSVALSGGTVVVGAPNEGTTGAAYVFSRSGAAWVQQAKLTASDAAPYDGFGSSVAINGDAAIIGAAVHASYRGAAYVFVRSGTGWSQQAKLTASDGAAFDEFGYSAALDGETAVVGAFYHANYKGSVYVFVRNGSVWSEQAELMATDGVSHDQFGGSVALTGDTAIVGASGKAGFSGAAYVFQRIGSVWIQQAELRAPNSKQFDSVGSAVSLSAGTVLAGAGGRANGTGACFVYTNLPMAASLSLSASTGSPLMQLTLKGSGFAPAETVLLAYNGGSQVPLGTVTADGGGTFTATVRLPLVQYSSGLMAAIGRTSGLTGAANFAVAPRLVMNPGSGSAGSNVVAQGLGFGAGEKVDVYWAATSQLLGTATADNTGSFYQTGGLIFRIPLGSAGAKAVAGRGQTTSAVGVGYVAVR
jgi:hypothetical protein